MPLINPSSSAMPTNADVNDFDTDIDVAFEYLVLPCA